VLYHIFETSPEHLTAATEGDKSPEADNDTEFLLSQGMDRWYATKGLYNLGLTKFALIDMERDKINLQVYGRFILAQALTYGYNDDQWWSIAENPRERLGVASELLQKKHESITRRIIGHLIDDVDIRLFPREMTEDMTASLLEIGTTSDNVFLRQQIFDGVRVLTQPGDAWTDLSLNTEQMKRLGTQALEDSEACKPRLISLTSGKRWPPARRTAPTTSSTGLFTLANWACLKKSAFKSVRRTARISPSCRMNASAN
jgi:hypothetical protein